MPPPINSVCPQALRTVDNQTQFTRDPACVETYLDQECPRSLTQVAGRTEFVRDVACVTRVTGEAPQPTPAPTPAADSTGGDDDAIPSRDTTFGFGAFRLGGQLALFPPIRANSANFAPENGGNLGFQLNLPEGDRLLLSAGLLHVPLNDRYPSDQAIVIRPEIGLAGSHELFRFGDDSNWRALLDQNTSLYLDVRMHDQSDTAVSVGVQDFIGASIDAGQHVNVGLGIIQRSEWGSSGPNTTPYNLTTGVNISFNLDPTETTSEIDPGALTRLRLVRLMGATTHAVRLSELGGGIAHIDGLRDDNMDFLVGGINAINYGNIAYNSGELSLNGSPTTSGVVSGVNVVGGLALELAGIFADQPMMSGTGAALFCGGASGIPSAAGSRDIWANRGTMISCGVVQGLVGTLLFVTAPDLGSGIDDPIQHVGAGDSDDMNPHLDTSGEAQRSSGIQILSAGVGTLGAGFFLTRDPRSESPSVNGAGVRVGGTF